jgi:hypothetical protein
VPAATPPVSSVPVNGRRTAAVETRHRCVGVPDMRASATAPTAETDEDLTGVRGARRGPWSGPSWWVRRRVFVVIVDPRRLVGDAVPGLDELFEFVVDVVGVVVVE